MIQPCSSADDGSSSLVLSLVASRKEAVNARDAALQKLLIIKQEIRQVS